MNKPIIITKTFLKIDLTRVNGVKQVIIIGKNGLTKIYIGAILYVI